jgi:acyl dehydratase
MMHAGTVMSFDELREAAGREVGPSEWMLIDQGRIDGFADAIDDHQWIHVDPARAADGPFGGTIAHGYLTLAAAATSLGDLLDVAGASRVINYGLDRVRFPAPVPAGARVRARVLVLRVVEIDQGFEVSAQVTAEVEGLGKPACVADVRIRYMR